MASFLDLPVELIVIILSYLDVRDLNAIADTCQSLNHVINNQELWKSMFRTRFGVDRFSSVSRSRKFSSELFERSEMMREWKKARATHIITPLRNTISVLSVQLHYPTAMALHDEGLLAVTNFSKAKSDYDIPVTAGQGATAVCFDSRVAVYGDGQGQLFLKNLTKRDVWNSKMSIQSPHTAMITALHNKWPKAYSGDLSGKVVVSDTKSLSVDKEYELPSPVLRIKGHRNTVIAICDSLIYVINAHGDGAIKSIPHELKNMQNFDVDFGGKNIILSDLFSVHCYSYDPEFFGNLTSYEVYHDEQLVNNEEITALALEQKDGLTFDRKIAGQDGCNLAIIVSRKKVVTFNIRSSGLKVQSELEPTLSHVYQVEPVCSVDVNSSLVAVGFYNGWAAVYDVLSGTYIRTVGNKLPARYLRSNRDTPAFPCRFIKLGRDNATYGVVVANRVLQYFHIGDDVGQNGKKNKKALAGGTDERKNKFDKTIKHAVHEMDEYDYQRQMNADLLERYNGEDLVDGEDLEMAIALNKSLNPTGDDEVDDELAHALEISRLEYESERNTTTDDLVPDSVSIETELPEEPELNEEEEFKKQLEEAMRRSLYD